MGEFAHCFTSVEDFPETDCKVEGDLPSWLKGTLLRNGPGKFEFGDTKYNHLFDGMAYFQKYDIENGSVKFTGKFLNSSAYERNKAANRIITSEFGTLSFPDPCKSIFTRYFSHYFGGNLLTDNDAVNFIELGDQIYAATEVPRYHQISLETLQSIKKERLPSDVVVLNTVTAHPHYDRNGDALNVGCSKDSFVIIRTPKNAGSLTKFEVVLQVPKSDPLRPTYFHSFGASENHVLVMESPLRLDLKTLMLPRVFGSVCDSMWWKTGTETELHIASIEKKEKVTHRYFTDPLFTFHHANTFEVSNERGQRFLVADYCGFDNGTVVKELMLENMRTKGWQQFKPEHLGHFKRIIMPLDLPKDAQPGSNLLVDYPNSTKATSILREDGSIFCSQDVILPDIPLEFPRYNYEQVNGRPYKYCYCSTLVYGVKEGIVKIDVENRKMDVWMKDSDHQMPTEPVFVARPGATDEDDGVVITPVITSDPNAQPMLLFLDARNWVELARAIIPTNVPMGFHEIFRQR